jgi:hypothetical protein
MERTIALLLLLPLLIAPAACRKSREREAEEMAEKIIESQSGGRAEVDLSDGKVTITTREQGKEGTMEISGGKGTTLPGDFPKDLPLYPGATVVSYVSMGPGTQQAHFTSRETMAAVQKFYARKLPGEGWQIIQELKMPNAYTIIGQKGKRQASVIIAQDGSGSGITLGLTEIEG